MPLRIHLTDKSHVFYHGYFYFFTFGWNLEKRQKLGKQSSTRTLRQLLVKGWNELIRWEKSPLPPSVGQCQTMSPFFWQDRFNSEIYGAGYGRPNSDSLQPLQSGPCLSWQTVFFFIQYCFRVAIKYHSLVWQTLWGQRYLYRNGEFCSHISFSHIPLVTRA